MYFIGGNENRLALNVLTHMGLNRVLMNTASLTLLINSKYRSAKIVYVYNI